MANVTYSTYGSDMVERKLRIDSFKGVDQGNGDRSNDYATSPDATNFITEDGALRTAGGLYSYGADVPLVTDSETPNSKPRLFQSFFRDTSGNDISVLVAAFNRKLYAYNKTANTWTAIGSVTQDGCDMINYRDETSEWSIFTDGAGKAYHWDGSTGSLTALVPTQDGDEVDFQRLALLNERLWGAVFKDAPDRIYYSNSFDPEDWEPNATLPDDGGGFIDVATFDGSRIRAVVSAFGDLMIFKDKSVHKIVGSYPGEWQLSQVFGSGGTISARSIVIAGAEMYFLAGEGLCRYDGSTIVTLKSKGDRKMKAAWAAMNHDALDAACAVFCNGRIYLSVCLDTTKSRNTHVIEYDVVNSTYSLVEVANIDDFLVLREGLKETLLAISWNKVYRYDSGGTFAGTAIAAIWTSPIIDTGTLASKKQVGRIYATVEGYSLTDPNSAKVKLTMISGDKEVSKTIPCAGLTDIRKQVRVKGRSFRFRIENVDGCILTIHRGIEFHVDEDYD